ncbi:MAG: hypothetical protein ACI841_000561 [Planctomycetota bacterium]|jgi:uncharacterized protein (TIGR00266 family)
MKIELSKAGAFASALVRLEPGDNFISESGAMYRASSNVDIDVTTKSRGKGGILGGLKRLLAAENFFFSTYTIMDGRDGEVGLAPTLQGDVVQIDVEPGVNWLCTGGSYLGSGPGLEADTQFQGMKGFFTGEALFYLSIKGQGPLLVTGFGRIHEIQVDDGLVVDTGHVVAFEESLDYEISKAGGSWLQSFLGGEGLVMRFKGQGRIYVQSHNPSDFGPRLGGLLPPRRQ